MLAFCVFLDMAEIILGIDQGTTGTTAILVDAQLRVQATCTKRVFCQYPSPGFVEQDSNQVWGSVEAAVKGCLEQAKVHPNQIVGIGIANQRETACLFEPSGQTVHPLVVWQCKRSASICEHLRQKGVEQMVRDKTGLVLDPYFSATKLMWLFSQYEEWKIRANKGDLLFGTVDSWLLYKMTGVHATDATNASRTLLFNLHAGNYDPELLELFAIPRTCLPQIGNSSQVYGVTKGFSVLPDGIPIGALVGDQQAALFGQACTKKGQAKATFGTGCFVLLHTGEQPILSKHGLLSSVALRLEGKDTFCLEGSAFIGGDAIRWLQEGLFWFQSPSDVQAWALQVSDSQEVVFVPSLLGLSAPYWKPKAKGLFCGLTNETSKGHIARAVLEGIAFQNYDILQAMQQEGGPLQTLRVDGGASQSDLLMQFQADLLQVPCVRPRSVEATALGAALLAGLSVGLWDQSRMHAHWQLEREFMPSMSKPERDRHIAKWQNALRMLGVA